MVHRAGPSSSAHGCRLGGHGHYDDWRWAHEEVPHPRAHDERKEAILLVDVETSYHDVPLGRMRSRALGARRREVPEVVLVQGMAVSDYLLPGLAALGSWSRAHLVDLPGLAGSGDPPRPLDVYEYGEAVASWLDHAALGRVVLGGHSSGTQVAAHAATMRQSAVGALFLASPTVDPTARSWLRLFVRWRLNGRHEASGLTQSHWPEWRRAGLRRLIHIVRIHLGDRLEDVVPHLPMPVLVLRGRQDRLLTDEWAHELTHLAPRGRFEEVPGAHTFPWAYPPTWSDPIRRLAQEASEQ